jgi:glycosyltransferase involved in cell wall biosynthesis
MENKRLRILIIAHECSPVQGSECAEGWNLVTRLAKYHDITVLYASTNQFGTNSYVTAIAAHLQISSPIIGLTFVNINQPKLTKILAAINSMFRRVGPIGLPFLYFIGYNYWQKVAYKNARRLHRQNSFDVVHQLTQITFREPGYSWKLGIPFVWGPTGGTSVLPKEFHKILSFQSSMLEWVRTFSNFYQFKFISRIIEANRRAAIIYAFSKEDSIRFKSRARGEVKLMLDAGTYGTSINVPRLNNSSRKIKGIWCGQLNDRKAPSILLNALAIDPHLIEVIDFQIIGSGPVKDLMHKKAKFLKLQNIQWIEKVSHDEIFDLMRKADFFVHTSLREATSNVIPEALSMGLPVICHDINGMSIAINESCGIKIPFSSPEDSIQCFHNAIKSLISDKNLLENLKVGTRKRSSEISWDVMAKTIADDYSEIVSLSKF